MMSDSQLVSKNVPSMCVMLFIFFGIINSEYLLDICMNIPQKASKQIKASWTRIWKINPTHSFHLCDQKCSL